MKKFKILTVALAIASSVMMLAGCSQTVASPAVGNWAYVHDEGTSILNLKANGKAEYKGEKYSFSDDGTYIVLSSGKNKLKLRYAMEGEDLYLYEPATYTYQGEGSPEGLIGVWLNPETKWSFEFSKDGTFKEDGYFPGYYVADEEAGTFSLVYNDHFEDTTVYYAIEGNELKVEYPWHMVKTK